jgi:hypothetical protein
MGRGKRTHARKQAQEHEVKRKRDQGISMPLQSLSVFSISFSLILPRSLSHSLAPQEKVTTHTHTWEKGNQKQSKESKTMIPRIFSLFLLSL